MNLAQIDSETNGDLSEHRQPLGALQYECPVRAALDVVRGRWKPSILYQLKMGPRRYSQLRTELPRVSHQALTTQLKQLTADGLVERQVYSDLPVRVEYRLSGFGESLSRVMDELEAWGQSYLEAQWTTPDAH